MSTPYYPTGCGTTATLPSYNCAPCLVTEKGRVRSVALVKDSFAFVNPSSTAEWTAGILANNIRIIWQTQGSYDGGSTSDQPGFGDLETVNGGTSHVLTFKDPNYLENADFYNTLRNTSEWSLVYRTSSSIHIINEPVTFTPKNPVQDDLNTYVVWEVQAKWSSNDSPVPYTTPAHIFDQCYIS